MKTKLALTSLALLLMNSAAFADCLQKYADSYDHTLVTSDMTSSDDLSIAGGILAYATATGGPQVSGPLSTTSTTLYGVSEYQQNKIVKPYNLVQDAEAGKGIMLKEFAKDTGMSQDQAAQFVRKANSSEELCSQSELLSYSEIVSLAKKQ